MFASPIRVVDSPEVHDTSIRATHSPASQKWEVLPKTLVQPFRVLLIRQRGHDAKVGAILSLPSPLVRWKVHSDNWKAGTRLSNSPEDPLG